MLGWLWGCCCCGGLRWWGKGDEDEEGGECTVLLRSWPSAKKEDAGELLGLPCLSWGAPEELLPVLLMLGLYTCLLLGSPSAGEGPVKLKVTTGRRGSWSRGGFLRLAWGLRLAEEPCSGWSEAAPCWIRRRLHLLPLSSRGCCPPQLPLLQLLLLLYSGC